MNLNVNDIAAGYRDINIGTEDGTCLALGSIRNAFAGMNTDMSVVNGSALTVKSFWCYSDGTNRSSGTWMGGLVSGVAAISKIYLALSSSYTFPAGTVIEVWGSVDS